MIGKYFRRVSKVVETFFTNSIKFPHEYRLSEFNWKIMFLLNMPENETRLEIN